MYVHRMYVRAYVCVNSPPFSGAGEVFGFVGGALEDFSGGPSHSAEIQRFKKNHSLLNQMSFLFLKGQLKTNVRQIPQRQKLDFIFFPCPFVLFFPEEGNGGERAVVGVVLVSIWVVILELVLVIWQFIRKKEAINCTKVRRFTANTTATAISQFGPPSLRRTWDPKTARMDVAMYS